MSCINNCCPPHNFTATTDPTVDDCCCDDLVVIPGYSGGYCTGSYWYNTTTQQMWIGANDMACGSALWLNLNPTQVDLAHVKVSLGAYQSVPTTISTKMEFLDVIYDANSDWDVPNTQFVAPRDGYYMVNLAVRPSTSPGVSTTGWQLGDNYHLIGKTNGVFVNDWISGSQTFQHSTGASQVWQRVISSHTATVYLNAGDLFTVEIAHDAAGAQEFHPDQTTMWIDELGVKGIVA